MKIYGNGQTFPEIRTKLTNYCEYQAQALCLKINSINQGGQRIQDNSQEFIIHFNSARKEIFEYPHPFSLSGINRTRTVTRGP